MTDAVAADQVLSSPHAAPADVEPIEAPADAAPPTEPEPPAFDPRGELPPSLGLPRRAILDALLDSDGPLTVRQLWDAMPEGTSKQVCESSIHRELVAKRIRRCGPGLYELAPPAPREPPPQAAVKTIEMLAGFAWRTDPAALRVMSEAEWNRVLDAYFADPTTWPADIGLPPDADGSPAPFDLVKRARDRHRKKLERQAEAAARAERQRQADAELRDELIAACQGNIVRSARLEDVSAIRRVLADGIPMDVILSAIRSKTDRRLYPGNQPATSWREPRLLKAIAVQYCRFTLAPAMAAAWAGVETAPRKPADAPDASAAVPGTTRPRRCIHGLPAR